MAIKDTWPRHVSTAGLVLDSYLLMCHYLAPVLLLWLTSTVAHAAIEENELSVADWPQFRGPDRSGVSTSTNLLKAWPEEGPRLVWRANGAGRGYSSVAITDDRLYTMGDNPSTMDDEDEYLSCYDLADGKLLWQTRLGPAWTEGSPSWQSSRSTPTVDHTRVYTLTAHGDVVCVDANKGQELWRKNLPDLPGQKGDGWGYSESVLIDGNRLICTPGGEQNTMVAFNKKTGELIWSASHPGDEGAAHSSIVISQVGGTRVYVQMTVRGPLGVRASDGKILWSYETPSTTAVIPTPIVRDDLVFFSIGYGVGGALVRQIPAGHGEVNIEEIYPLQRSLANKHGGVVLVGDQIYGDSGAMGVPFCADLLTGELLWKKRGSGHGSASLVVADGHLYIWFSNSVMVLAKATPDGYEEISSFEVKEESDRPSWAHPVVTGGRLYLRKDDFVYCYELRANAP